jgi:hypothetical protein
MRNPYQVCGICGRRRTSYPLAFCRRCYEERIDPAYKNPPEDSAFMRERERRIRRMAWRAARGLPLFDDSDDGTAFAR